MPSPSPLAQVGSRFAPMVAIAPLVIAIAIITAGSGLLTTKTSVELAIRNVSVETVRIIVTGYPVGFLIGCLTAHSLISRLGHGRAFQATTLLTTAATLAFMLSTDAWFWAFLRAINGFCMASMFTVAESWINLDSGPRNRGSLISFYMIMSTLGLATGQAMINLGDPAGNGLLVLAAATCFLAAVPFSIDGRMRPAARMANAAAPAEVDERFGILRLAVAAPVAVVAAVQTGMTNMTFGVLGPIYATKTDHSPAIAAAMVTMFSAGGFVAQMPIGWLSDRLDRRLILAGAGLGAALSCLGIALFGHVSVVLLFALVFIYGLTALSIYPVAIAYGGSRVQSRFIVAISGQLLMIYAIGSVVAPGIANELMARIAPSALFLFLGAAALTVAMAGVWEFIRGSTGAAAP